MRLQYYKKINLPFVFIIGYYLSESLYLMKGWAGNCLFISKARTLRVSFGKKLFGENEALYGKNKMSELINKTTELINKTTELINKTTELKDKFTVFENKMTELNGKIWEFYNKMKALKITSVSLKVKMEF